MDGLSDQEPASYCLGILNKTLVSSQKSPGNQVFSVTSEKETINSNNSFTVVYGCG